MESEVFESDVRARMRRRGELVPLHIEGVTIWSTGGEHEVAVVICVREGSARMAKPMRGDRRARARVGCGRQLSTSDRSGFQNSTRVFSHRSRSAWAPCFDLNTRSASNSGTAWRKSTCNPSGSSSGGR